MECFKLARNPLFQFRQAAERYRMIRSAQIPVVVPYGKNGDAIVEKLKAAGDEPLKRKEYRALQPFTVGVYEYALRGLLGCGIVVTAPDQQICYLTDPKAYDKHYGLKLDLAGLDPEQLMACDSAYPTQPYMEDYE